MSDHNRIITMAIAELELESHKHRKMADDLKPIATDEGRQNELTLHVAMARAYEKSARILQGFVEADDMKAIMNQIDDAIGEQQ